MTPSVSSLAIAKLLLRNDLCSYLLQQQTNSLELYLKMVRLRFVIHYPKWDSCEPSQLWACNYTRIKSQEEGVKDPISIEGVRLRHQILATVANRHVERHA